MVILLGIAYRNLCLRNGITLHHLSTPGFQSTGQIPKATRRDLEGARGKQAQTVTVRVNKTLAYHKKPIFFAVFCLSFFVERLCQKF